LTQASLATPITKPATGLLIYNTARQNDVLPGYYYWEGNRWVRFNTTNAAARLAAGGGQAVPAYLLNKVRALTTVPDHVILVEAGREGLFRYDNTDNTSPDNGGTILVTASNKRYKRAFSGPVDVKWFGTKGDGSTDDTNLLQTALNNTGTGSAVLFSTGTYRTTSPLTIPDNVQVTFSKAAKISVTTDFSPYFVGGNDAAYVFIMGNNSLLDQAFINLNGKITGGIVGITRHDYMVRGCTVQNYGGVKFGIADVGCQNVSVINNTLFNGIHGINSYRSDGTLVSGNFIDIMKEGGYYSAWTRRVLVTGNIIKNCGDVGLDFEGGEYNTGTANTVERCKNGELTIFSGADADPGAVSHHLVLKRNVVHRRATYATARDAAGVETTANCDANFGACSFASLDQGAYESGFEDNRLFVDFGWGLYHTQLGMSDKNGRNVFFRGNSVTSSAGFIRTFDSDGLHITDNTFEGLPGSETIENIVRDPHGLIMADNQFSYVNPKTTNYAIRLLTLSAFATKAPLFARNSFTNCGSWATQIDLYQNGNLNPTIQANNLGTTYTLNGGLSITPNGNARLVDQPLKLALVKGPNNVGGIDGLSRSGQTTKAFGFLGYGRPGYNGLSATLQVMYGSGIYVAVGIQPFGLSATVDSNGSLVLNNNTGNAADDACTGKLDLTVNSSQ
jgi:hypothetical protein